MQSQILDLQKTAPGIAVRPDLKTAKFFYRIT